VEHGANTYKKTRKKKTLEMVLLPITMFDDSEINMEVEGNCEIVKLNEIFNILVQRKCTKLR
jgi:hypothetical protein